MTTREEMIRTALDLDQSMMDELLFDLYVQGFTDAFDLMGLTHGLKGHTDKASLFMANRYLEYMHSEYSSTDG